MTVLADLRALDRVQRHRCLLEPIGNIPPAEAEANYYRQRTGLAMAA